MFLSHDPTLPGNDTASCSSHLKETLRQTRSEGIILDIPSVWTSGHSQEEVKRARGRSGSSSRTCCLHKRAANGLKWIGAHSCPDVVHLDEHVMISLLSQQTCCSCGWWLTKKQLPHYLEPLPEVFQQFKSSEVLLVHTESCGASLHDVWEVSLKKHTTPYCGLTSAPGWILSKYFRRK